MAEIVQPYFLNPNAKRRGEQGGVVVSAAEKSVTEQQVCQRRVAFAEALNNLQLQEDGLMEARL